MYDIDGVYRSLSTAKNHSKNIKRRAFLGCRLLQTPGEENSKKRKEKRYLSLAIGENYINKMFFLLTFYLFMFLLIANRKESEKNSHRKGR